MARKIATDTTVDRDGMLAFVRDRNHCVLSTTRRDGRPQMSLVTMGVDAEGRIAMASYPERVKALNIRRNPAVSVCVMSDKWNGDWIQLDGTGEVVDLPDALDGLVEYFRSISGEHSDWDEYRQAMVDQGKVLIRVNIERWSPISCGGFPARLVE